MKVRTEFLPECCFLCKGDTKDKALDSVQAFSLLSILRRVRGSVVCLRGSVACFGFSPFLLSCVFCGVCFLAALPCFLLVFGCCCVSLCCCLRLLLLCLCFVRGLCVAFGFQICSLVGSILIKHCARLSVLGCACWSSHAHYLPAKVGVVRGSVD